MDLPFVLLAGLLVAMVDHELGVSLPGSGEAWRVACTAPLLLLPMALAITALRLARRQLLTGRAPQVPLRALLRLSAMASPLAVHAVFALGTYDDCVDRLAWNDPGWSVLLIALPPFVAELLRVWPVTLAGLLEEVVRDRQGVPARPEQWPTRGELRPMVRLRLGWPLLLMLPIGVLTLLVQGLATSRELHVLTLVTSPGVLFTAIAFVSISVVLLPWMFRWVFAVDGELPEPAGTRLRAVAAQLGFPPSRVLRLPTGERALNAMMVGPLPFGRFLCLTDGILRTVEVEALAGVVAHEAGHARRNHPALLFVLALSLTALALSSRFLVAVQELAWPWQLAIGTAVIVAAFACIRALAIRFEFEADAVSTEALGAAPCTHALRAVVSLAQPMRPGLLARWTSLHPDESARYEHMLRHEIDPVYRAAFRARGRRVRQALAALVVLAASTLAWSWHADWPRERVIVDLLCGDVVAASTNARALAEPPPHWRERWQHVTDELAVATAVAPEVRDWTVARDAYRSAWARGEQVLLAKGPAAARPWFSLALGAMDAPSDVQRAVRAYCEAAGEEQVERMAALRELVLRLGVPTALQPVFEEDPATGR